MDKLPPKNERSKTVLLASLAANILLISFAVGLAAGQGSNGPTGVFKLDPQQRVEILAGLLPAADAELLRRSYENRGNLFAVTQSDHDEAVRRVLALMAQPKLDLPALRAALAKARSNNERLNDLLSETLLEAIQKMPASSRVAFAGEYWR